MDSKVCECCQELTGGFPLCLDQFFFEKNDLQRPKMLKKWFLVIFKAHSPLRQKNGIFKRDQTQNHACLTQTNDFIPYTNIYNQIIIWGPYLAISGHCENRFGLSSFILEEEITFLLSMLTTFSKILYQTL